eukprot:PhM_4_TR6966/c0_g1_i1/m.17319
MITRPASAYVSTPDRRALVSATPTEERLASVKSNLANLSQSLRQDMDSKREFEENRLYEMKELTNKIERHLALEVRRRTESDRVLQAMIEHKVKEVQETVDKKINDKLVLMQHNVDILTKKLERVTSELAAERDKTSRLTEELRVQYRDGLHEIKQGVEHEKAQRMEKEAMLLKRLTEDVHRMQERLDVERHTRDTALRQVKDDLQRFGANGGKPAADEKFRIHVLDDIECLKTALQLETEARERGEDGLATTMDELVRQVQAGLRMVPS